MYPIKPLNAISQEKLDVLFCALGYESRSRFIAMGHAPRAEQCVAIGFDYQISGDIEENKRAFDAWEAFSWQQEYGFDSPHVNDVEFKRIVVSVLERARIDTVERPIRIGVDISSLSLLRLAYVVEALCELPTEVSDVQVEFLYSVGKGHAIGEECEQIAHAGPVTGGFAGWARDPRAPVVAIFGLGFEFEKSIGAFELINPATSYAFSTAGTNAVHDTRIDKANELFLPLIPPDQKIAFDAAKPMDCYKKLRSVASGSLRDGRPVFVPLGPKIFGLCCLLIAREYYPRMSVWRISTGRHGLAKEVAAEGSIVGLEVSIRALLAAAYARKG